jgi:amino acid transporter
MSSEDNHKDNGPPPTEHTPLLASASVVGESSHAVPQHATFAKGLNARDGFVLLITVIVGSGIFASPSAIDTNVPSPGVGVFMWAAGGLLAWTGAATLAELGAALPGEGGIQEYCKYVYGDWAGFLAAWAWVTAVMPATLSILGILAGIVVAIIYAASHGHHDPGGRDWHEKGWFDKRISVNPDGSTIDWKNVSSWETFGHICTAIYAALWAYAGWDKVTVPLLTFQYLLTDAARQTTPPPNSKTPPSNSRSPSTQPSPS